MKGKKNTKEESGCNIMLFAPRMVMYHRYRYQVSVSVSFKHTTHAFAVIFQFCMEHFTVNRKWERHLAEIVHIFFTQVFLGTNKHFFWPCIWPWELKLYKDLHELTQLGSFTRKTFLESKFKALHMIIIRKYLHFYMKACYK